MSENTGSTTRFPRVRAVGAVEQDYSALTPSTSRSVSRRHELFGKATSYAGVVDDELQPRGRRSASVGESLAKPP